MSKYVAVDGFHIVCRFDGSWAVYDYAWWPDEYLDNDPVANKKYLTRTKGWRAKGWIVVHVAGEFAEAKRWALGNGHGS